MTSTDPTPASMGGPLSEADRAEVLVEGSWFKVDDLPEILGNFMRSSDEHAREAKALSMKLAEVRARVGVLEGQLATAQAQLAIVDEHIAYQHKLGRRISETDDQLEQQRLLGHAEARKALAYALAGSPAVDDEGIDCDY